MHYYMYGKVLEPPPSLIGVACLQGGEQTPELMHNLSSSSSIVSNDPTIYCIGEETMAPSSALPIGATRVVCEMQSLVLALHGLLDCICPSIATRSNNTSYLNL
ncbi:uncharacterized protein LAESUDRAFT_765551 [Laetiporus sulphureus 93-53]|uniref:Uncharacterized protein n=1 Tax=Laetiporus sulphureus 93-53 TaxID=1314785 RepID=A0A165APP1_9APHY|nr:uncharacterized protein LAESUDRAFT_765551 [Laetiporus sulphureus 93-53]KZS99418.1 hypothetical protein LAESUDRAFT_765551 [Laetiporus sulphureus 93-53]